MTNSRSLIFSVNGAHYSDLAVLGSTRYLTSFFSLTFNSHSGGIICLQLLKTYLPHMKLVSLTTN